MITIHNNFESVRLSRHISNRLSSLNVTFGRISTGLRINSASDDSAGLQIRNRISKQIIEAQAEIKNITNESSLLQVAQGALNESLSALQKMREIAVAAGNQTLSIDDRVGLQNDFKELMSHIDELSETTTYNGKKILSQESTQLQLSLLENSGESQALSSALQPSNTSNLGVQARYESAQRGVFLSPLESGDLTINGVSVRGTTYFDDQVSYCYRSGSAISKAKVINSISQFTGVRAILDENVLTSREPLGPIDLSNDKWLKINGVKLAGLQVESHDATHELRETANALQSQTGVYATVDGSGHLVLSAKDSRNITIEYSDRDVRKAIGILDPYGDPINVADVVEPAVYERDGDIVSVDYTGAAAGFSATVAGDPDNPSDQSGSYSGERDLVDFVLEVVKPGPVGVATYRVKQEDLTQVPSGTKDTNEEDYLFNGTGVISEADASKLFDVSTSYSEGSTRQVKVVVKEEGNILASDVNDRPLVDLILYNVDSNLEDEIVQDVRLEQGKLYDDFLADYGISFKVDEPGQASYSNANGSVSATSALDLELTSGTGYAEQPEVLEWTGTIKTEFNILVTQDGHGISVDDLSGTPPAELTVTASIYRDGSPTPTETESKTLTLSERSTADVTYDAVNESYTIHFADPGAGDLTLRFPPPPNTTVADGVTTPTWVTTSGYDLAPGFDDTYTGNSSLDYLIRFTSAGAFTSEVGDGPSADIIVNGVVEDSIGEVDDTYFNLLGPNGWEGLRLQMQSPVIDSQRSTTQYAGNDMTYSVGTYNEENREVIVEITKSGGTSGAADQLAEYKYYYADDPSTILGTGRADFGSGVTLVNADGLTIQGDANTTNTVTSLTSTRTTTSLRNIDVTTYDSELVGTMTARFIGNSDPQYTISSTGRVRYDDYSTGGAPSTFTSSVSVSGTTPYTTAQTFYVYFHDDYAYLTRGSGDNDIDSVSVLRSNRRIDGSNTFNFGGGDRLTLTYNPSGIDDDDSWTWGSTGGSMTAMKFQMRPPSQDLEVSWAFEGGGTSGPTTITDVHNQLNQTVDLGHGVSAQLPTSAVENNARYIMEVTPENLKVGDKFYATLESQVSAGDELSFTANPSTSSVGSEWELSASAPAWLENEVETITYNHSYEDPVYTLGAAVSYPPGTGGESFDQLQISSIGNLRSGDEIRVKTRAFLGDVISSGTYTETGYPTDYILTVTQGGDISAAGGGDTVTVSWTREDGLSDLFLEGGGAGTFTLTSADLGQEITLEEGVKVSFSDLGEGAYLATGDQIIIPAGQRLEYSFAAGLSLQSRENIELSYGSTSTDSVMGRMFASTPSPAGAPNQSLTSGLLGKSATRSLSTVGLLTSRQINEAIETIDLAIDQIGESMARVGGVMNRAVHRIESLNQQALDMMIAQGRIEGADFAKEAAKMASEQISLMSAPFLLEVSNSEALQILDLISHNDQDDA